MHNMINDGWDISLQNIRQPVPTPRTDNELRIASEQETEPAAQINYLTKLARTLERELESEKNLHGQAQAAAYEVNDVANKLRAENTWLKKRVGELREALGEIASEAQGALNNAFPDEAPDVLANVAGIARRTLTSPNNV